jgi:hypothetical protein
VDELNAKIPAMVAQKNALSFPPIVIVNQAEGFNADTDNTDGIHPSINGDVKVATKWFNALTTGPSPVCSAKPLLTNALVYKPFNIATLNGVGSPEKAFNGETVFDGWDNFSNSADPQTITLDLGVNFTLHYLELFHASMVPGLDAYNTRAYHIEVSTDNASWTPVDSMTGNVARYTTHNLITPALGRYVRLTIDNPNVWGTSYNRAIIREFRAMGIPQ